MIRPPQRRLTRTRGIARLGSTPVEYKRPFQSYPKGFVRHPEGIAKAIGNAPKIAWYSTENGEEPASFMQVVLLQHIAHE
jgi:hypothetical protein